MRKSKFLIFFSCELPLILELGRNLKIRVRDICERTLDIDFEWDWWVGLGPALGDGKNLKYIFPVSGIFPGKADSVILLCFECTINLQNLIKIVRAIFEKFEILIFFLMWTTLNFRDMLEKGKIGRRHLQGDSRYRIWTILVSWFRYYFNWRTEN